MYPVLWAKATRFCTCSMRRGDGIGSGDQRASRKGKDGRKAYQEKILWLVAAAKPEGRLSNTDGERTDFVGGVVNVL
jgi:hypothetical protein